MRKELKSFDRILMGPGPSNIHPRVLKAMTTTLVSHFDPYIFEILDEISEMLRMVFETRNEFTIAISGSGSAGMEASLCNVVEPGDEIIVAPVGTFGERMAEMVKRLGGRPMIVKQERGGIIQPDRIEKALEESNAKAVAIVHVETSSCVMQPLERIGEIIRNHGALLIVDAVASLGGAPVKVDEWNIDICYSGTQKCLNAPPGLAPITINKRAWEAIENRRSPIPSFYFDATLLKKYWSEERLYHHTVPVSTAFALYEALRIIEEEGLESRFEKHRLAGEAVRKSLEAMGLELFAQKGYEAPVITSVKIPEGIDDAKFRSIMLNKENIEIGGGLDVLKGKIWRVGHMGYGAEPEFVLPTLAAMEKTLIYMGYHVEPGTAVAVASRVLEKPK